MPEDILSAMHVGYQQRILRLIFETHPEVFNEALARIVAQRSEEAAKHEPKQM